MTVDEIYAELDAAISEMMGMPVVCHDWPCGHVPDGGYEAALREDDGASWWTDRRPVYAPDDELWPPQPLFPDDPDSELYCYVEPVPFYSTDMAAAWKVFLYVMKLDSAVWARFYSQLQQMTQQQEPPFMLVKWPYVLTELRHEMPMAICRAALMAV